MSLHPATLLLALVPFLFAAKCRDQPIVDDGTVVDPLPPEATLQITSVDPRRPEANKGFRARIIGQGFVEGAKARVGDIDITAMNFIDENALIASVPALAPGGYDVRVTNPDGATATLRAGVIVRSIPPDLTADCRSSRIFFGLDQSSLNSEALGVLGAKSSCFGVENISVRIEGHCDERGTTEYNLALGQRRAEAVKRHLVSKGVSPSRITTTSYGEEKPLVTGSNESAWTQNRRAEIIITE